MASFPPLLINKPETENCLNVYDNNPDYEPRSLSELVCRHLNQILLILKKTVKNTL
jgi:hypothetical protein